MPKEEIHKTIATASSRARSIILNAANVSSMIRPIAQEKLTPDETRVLVSDVNVIKGALTEVIETLKQLDSDSINILSIQDDADLNIEAIGLILRYEELLSDLASNIVPAMSSISTLITKHERRNFCDQRSK